MVSSQHRSAYRRPLTSIFAVLALAVTLLTPTTFAGNAEAVCSNSSGGNFTINGGGGKEQASSSATCDGDNFYSGRVSDTTTDLSCVWIVAQVNGVWKTVSQDSCNSSGRSYSFSDTNSFTATYVCRYQGCSAKINNIGF